jgi:hypothetical protein
MTLGSVQCAVTQSNLDLICEHWKLRLGTMLRHARKHDAGNRYKKRNSPAIDLHPAFRIQSSIAQHLQIVNLGLFPIPP